MQTMLAISLWGVEIGFVDLIDIAIVAFLIYQAILIIRGTGAVQLGFGIAFLLLIFFQWTLTKILPYLVFIIIILFQHEIRKAVTILGQNPLVKIFTSRLGRQPLDEVLLAVTAMASKRIGGIIVLERETGLKNFVESGVAIDAKVSYDLLMSIFNPASPLHDGAVIIHGDRISAAACFLPLTLNPYLARELGTRHRAAIGLSEEADSVIIVVSEETGKISLVYNELLTTDLDGPELKEKITEFLALDRKAAARKFFRRGVNLP
jgi:uncharacterized protein (TIGR00159 family)